MTYHDYDFGITLSEIPEQDVFSPFPPGEYRVHAKDVELKNTKMGDGKYLQFEFIVEEGSFANRKIFQNVMVEHPNEDAKRIGLQWLKSWMIACNGLGTEQLSLSLIFRFLRQSCVAVIAIETGKAGYPDKNKIQRFKKTLSEISTDAVPF